MSTAHIYQFQTRDFAVLHQKWPIERIDSKHEILQCADPCNFVLRINENVCCCDVTWNSNT